MKKIDSQGDRRKTSVKNDGESVKNDGNRVIYDAFSGTDAAAKTHISIANICVQHIYLGGKGRYDNGAFVIAFCDAMKAIAMCKDFAGATLRVLLYLMGSTTKELCFGVSMKDIMGDLGISDSSVHRAIKDLSAARIICARGDGRSRTYRLTDRYDLHNKLMNPRVATYGNSRKVNKAGMPLLLTPGGDSLLPEYTDIVKMQRIGGTVAPADNGEPLPLIIED